LIEDARLRPGAMERWPAIVLRRAIWDTPRAFCALLGLAGTQDARSPVDVADRLTLTAAPTGALRSPSPRTWPARSMPDSSSPLHQLREFGALRRYLDRLIDTHDNEAPAPDTAVSHAHPSRRKTASTIATDLPVPLIAEQDRVL
jgi:hypothetical protein